MPRWLRAPHQLRLIFLAVMLLLSAALGWLGWRLLRQQEELSNQRLAERRELAADLVVAGLEKRLFAIDQELGRILMGGGPANPSRTGSAVTVQFLQGSIKVWPLNSLIYYPELAVAITEPTHAFDAVDQLEFRKRDYAGAISALASLAASADVTVRAAALTRLARNYQKNGQPAEAVRTYDKLAALGGVPVAGMPASLAARAGALAVFEQQKDTEALARMAQTLAQDLNAARWPVTANTYRYLSEQAQRYQGAHLAEPKERLAVAEGVERLSEIWRQKQDGAATAGTATLETSFGGVLLISRISGSSLAGFVAAGEYLRERIAEIAPRNFEVALIGPQDRYVLGGRPARGSHPAVRLSSATQLPWTVQVSGAGESAESGSIHRRRGLLIAGLCVLLALILTGAGFVGRVMEREVAVARLQSDFVSAVSHEFRTPLTTLCQLSELLVRGRVANDEDREQYYRLIYKDSDRLRRLVEGLLNFGRLEAGKMPYAFEELDPVALVRECVAEFSQEEQSASHRFDVKTDGDLPAIRGDRDALRCVLRNLLENAVKYSPNCGSVSIDLTRSGARVEIAVRDHGVGIPRSEQRRIFERFVRGSAAIERNIRGTGVGLTVARQIVRAHGGEIGVESEAGKGSAFRVKLPLRSTV